MSARLAITCGDPAGIGPEVVEAWLGAHPDQARDAAVIGPARWLGKIPQAGEKIPVGLEDFEASPGRPDGDGALVAWAALERAAAGCRAGDFSGVVTAPVSKERMAAIGWGFPGHTEFFAERWGGQPTMAFCGTRMRVALLTWHIPLKEVGSYLTEPNLARAVAASAELARIFPSEGAGPGSRAGGPRIGVCGLNPHAGEGGLIGREEAEVLDPILDRLRKGCPGLSRALPADTLFARQLRGDFDVVLALYHDQGLAPLKAVEFDEAVNVTLGLPFVRTSPDHGTAFGIAGRGLASPRSFDRAVAVARRLVEARR